jgi:amino acid transporter
MWSSIMVIKSIPTKGNKQRPYQRPLNQAIFSYNFFNIVLSFILCNSGCWNFFRKLKKKNAHKKLKKPPSKIAYLWQFGVFFLCSPDYPKQPRTSIPFYKFFYPTISGRISGNKASQKSRGILFYSIVDSLIATKWTVKSANTFSCCMCSIH